ncbi:hypothetical protein BATDEDRAFT_92869 [Batrachochytrium dendrobatidis JAM81]|uniref:Uncharacterized protein n=1 Tax=Batrachochytrium dendrobatidis (strain JAM81 / FGSC 10211) TaxID=684364 RepID=F4PEN8_BATDJ|nr:uncharacterized protein BATDEDRAFT_92869 [Batrachochytrium dendrobatidis JAM81]EGF76283.1 hypothetical protein BATDEDRAFT_92869 [Batrachochytrium dendrobatidis JAM81]|eukprot:XP_006683107.1 hypothetical protein BATDEDRAFT_92869 [Batrachochytrium dendrobatidis JAM81]
MRVKSEPEIVAVSQNIDDSVETPRQSVGIETVIISQGVECEFQSLASLQLNKRLALASRRRFVAELIGTFLMLTFATGAVSSQVLTGALKGIWQNAVVVGIATTCAIYLSGSTSGGHLNPAITLAMATFGCKTGFQWNRVPSYILAQILGGILAGIANLFIWNPIIVQFESRNNITRNQLPGCTHSAMLFGTYFPNPDIYKPGSPDAINLVSPWRAFGVEVFATAILAFVIVGLCDRGNRPTIHPAIIPPAIGAIVAALISVFGPITMAAMNPARDLGPRIAAAIGGWGECAFGGDMSFLIYTFGPCIGSILGAAVYLTFLYHSDEELKDRNHKSTAIMTTTSNQLPLASDLPEKLDSETLVEHSAEVVSLEVVTEHLGFAPVHFIDDMIDRVNSLLYKSMAKLEELVSVELGKGIETDRGMASIETLFESCVDKRFDRFEVFGLRNVFAVQPDLAMQLTAFQECNVDITLEQELALDADIDVLRKQLLAGKLQEKDKYLDNVISHLNIFGDQLVKLESIAVDNKIYPLSEKLVELSDKIATLSSVTDQVHVRTTHPIMREKICDSDRRMQLLQSEIAMHIKKRRHIAEVQEGLAMGKGNKANGSFSNMSAWDVTREYRDAMSIGSVKEMEAFKENVLL